MRSPRSRAPQRNCCCKTPRRRPTRLMRAVRAAGSDAVAVRAYVWHAPGAAGEAGVWLAAFVRNADARVVCGRAQSATSGMLLVTARAGSLEPLASESARVRGSLSDRFRDPELVVADGYGDLQRIQVDRAQLARGIPIASDLARPARVQLLARGPFGPRPIAERVLPAFDGAAPDDPPVEASRGRRLATDGRRNGSTDYAPTRAGLRCATTNCSQLLRKSTLTTYAPVVASRTSSRRATIRSSACVQPASARAASAKPSRAPRTRGAAFLEFERSPSHRFTLLETGFTDAGTGQAKDAQGRTCLVVLLAEWPRFAGR